MISRAGIDDSRITRVERNRATAERTVADGHDRTLNERQELAIVCLIGRAPYDVLAELVVTNANLREPHEVEIDTLLPTELLRHRLRRRLESPREHGAVAKIRFAVQLRAPDCVREGEHVPGCGLRVQPRFANPDGELVTPPMDQRIIAIPRPTGRAPGAQDELPKVALWHL